MAVDESVSRDRIYTSVRARLFGTCGPWCARAALLRRLAVRPAESSWVCPTSALSTNRLLVTRRDVPVAARGASIHHSRRPIMAAPLSGVTCGLVEGVFAGVPGGKGTSYARFATRVRGACRKGYLLHSWGSSGGRGLRATRAALLSVSCRVSGESGLRHTLALFALPSAPRLQARCALAARIV